MVRHSPKARRRSGSPKPQLRKGCPAGQIKRKAYVRKAYTTKQGKVVKSTRVKSGCIKKQGSTLPRQRASPRAQIRKNSCGPGQIPRASYTRKSFVRKDGTRVKQVRVKQGCIKDIGRPGRGKPIIQAKYKLRKGALTALGYHVDDSTAVRRNTLMKAVKDGVPINSLIWKLVAQANYRKNRSPSSAEYARGQRFKADQEFLSALKKKKVAAGRGRKSPVARRPAPAA